MMEANAWPLPAFYFRVTIAGQQAAFCEVSSLDPEAQVVEYRHTNSPAWAAVNMPGLKKHGNITLKKGVFKADNAFWDWYKETERNTICRQEVVITLMDDRGTPAMTWTLRNAWPVKIICHDLQINDNEVAVETLELAHEGIMTTNG